MRMRNEDRIQKAEDMCTKDTDLNLKVAKYNGERYMLEIDIQQKP